MKVERSDGYVAVVTGGSEGIGMEVSKLLMKTGYHVVVGCLNPQVASRNLIAWKNETLPPGSVTCLYLDLASFGSVRQFADTFFSLRLPLHLLINNGTQCTAGIMMCPKTKTTDGLESHFQVNYLSHFLLTLKLLPILKKTGKNDHPSRIINRPEHCALDVLEPALNPSLKAGGGRYLEEGEVVTPKAIACDTSIQRELWNISYPDPGSSPQIQQASQWRAKKYFKDITHNQAYCVKTIAVLCNWQLDDLKMDEDGSSNFFEKRNRLLQQLLASEEKLRELRSQQSVLENLRREAEQTLRNSQAMGPLKTPSMQPSTQHSMQTSSLVLNGGEDEDLRQQVANLQERLRSLSEITACSERANWNDDTGETLEVQRKYQELVRKKEYIDGIGQGMGHAVPEEDRDRVLQRQQVHTNMHAMYYPVGADAGASGVRMKNLAGPIQEKRRVETSRSGAGEDVPDDQEVDDESLYYQKLQELEEAKSRLRELHSLLQRHEQLAPHRGLVEGAENPTPPPMSVPQSQTPELQLSMCKGHGKGVEGMKFGNTGKPKNLESSSPRTPHKPSNVMVEQQQQQLQQQPSTSFNVNHEGGGNARRMEDIGASHPAPVPFIPHTSPLSTFQLERDQCVGEEPMLNNRVEPSWRANNYYDNLRSTSFQNALSREPEMLHRDAKRVSLAPQPPSMRRQLHLCKDNLHPSESNCPTHKEGEGRMGAVGGNARDALEAELRALLNDSAGQEDVFLGFVQSLRQLRMEFSNGGATAPRNIDSQLEDKPSLMNSGARPKNSPSRNFKDNASHPQSKRGSDGNSPGAAAAAAAAAAASASASILVSEKSDKGERKLGSLMEFLARNREQRVEAVIHHMEEILGAHGLLQQALSQLTSMRVGDVEEELIQVSVKVLSHAERSSHKMFHFQNSSSSGHHNPKVNFMKHLQKEYETQGSMEEDDEDGSERKSTTRVRLPGSMGQSSSLLNCESPGPSTGIGRYGLENASTVSIAGSMSSNRPRSPISSMGGEEGMSVTGNQSEAPSSSVAVNHLDARNSRSLPRNQCLLQGRVIKLRRTTGAWLVFQAFISFLEATVPIIGSALGHSVRAKRGIDVSDGIGCLLLDSEVIKKKQANLLLSKRLGSGGVCDTATPSEGNETQELAEADQSQGSATEGVEEEDSVSEGAACQTENALPVMVGQLPDDFLCVAPTPQQQIASIDHETAAALAYQNFQNPSGSGPVSGGYLSVTIVMAQLVKNYGMTRMDPYARLRVGHTVFETHTDANGARTPRWNKPGGMARQYYMMPYGYPSIGFGMSAPMGAPLPVTVSPQAPPVPVGQDALTHTPTSSQQRPRPTLSEKELEEMKEMFPGIEEDVIKTVFDANQGNKDSTHPDISGIPMIDWHNYTQISMEEAMTGPGEHGIKLHTNEGIQEVDELYKVNGFNGYASDMIALNRSLPDIRHPKCKEKKYLKELPNVSVIVPFHNEHWSTLLRTAASVLNRSPPNMVKEVILVDDASTKDFLKEKLDKYVKEHMPRVRVVHLPTRSGLILARLAGAHEATGNILIFLDSHCEATTNWLPPLLGMTFNAEVHLEQIILKEIVSWSHLLSLSPDPIARDKRTVVCPFIDVIDYHTFEYRAQDEGARGSFDWEFFYKRLPLLPEDVQNMPEPFKSPIMAGGLFAISSDFFWELGGYDEGLQIWGGEQYELSFKIWQCGGQMLDAPCSRIGHIYRKYAPFPNPGIGDFVGRNYRRVATVWMDEYAEYLYMRRPHYKKIDPGDLTKQKAIRETLNCKPFRWFMKNVAFDQMLTYPPIEPPDFASGEIRSLADSSLCVDSNFKGQNERIGLEKCKKENPHIKGEQEFHLTWHKDIRPKSRTFCLDVSTHDSRAPILMYPCHGHGGNQLWQYDGENKWLIHGGNPRCLDHNPSNQELFVAACDKGSLTQRWKVEHVNFDVIEKYWKDPLAAITLP
ncbi:unnamed protein product [Darwinula stevensoni]|uniref:polypeptide N-acetylgalactosaminyltransferase n=1 Tax=Darwinula stevensoni TaxID=69355 RepID=A0A7R8X0H7_9CRUS|nr:unnamed protein product [Darwinula stevensoni]CAG0878876.1 unnamed protein product [Darwinula stevensoni]